MTGMLGVSAKIASGRVTSPLRSPRASKKGTSSGLASLASSVFLARDLAALVRVAAITRGPRKIGDFLGCSYLPRVRLAGRAFRLDLLGQLANQHERALGSGHAAFDHDEVAIGVHANDLVGARGGALVAHLSRHPHALEHPRRVGRTDGARLADVHRAVALGAPAELVALDESLEALAHAGARDIDELPGREQVGLELLTGLDAGVVADLDDVPLRIDAGLLELPGSGVGELALLDGPEGDPDGAVAVLLLRAQAEHLARARLEHGDGAGSAVGVEQLGHAQLLGQQTLHLALDLDAHAGRQGQTHQGVDDPRVGVEDVDDSLVCAHLELLAGILVDEGRADDRQLGDLGRERDRAGSARVRAAGGVNDLVRRLVQHTMVVCLEPDPNLLRHYLKSPTFSGPKSLPLGVPTAKPWEARFGPKCARQHVASFIQATSPWQNATYVSVATAIG